MVSQNTENIKHTRKYRNHNIYIYVCYIDGIPEYREHKTYNKIHKPHYMNICLLYRDGITEYRNIKHASKYINHNV